MAGVLIKDATGDGYGAKVDNFNRVRTFSTGTTQEHHGTGLGVNFMYSTVVQAISLSLPTPQSGAMLWLRNDNPNALLVITKIITSTDRDGVAVKLIKNDVLGTAANNTVGTPNNLNFQSGVAAQATLQVWDETGGAGIGGLSGGTDIEAYTLGLGTTFQNIDGAIDLGSGNALTIHMNNSTAGAAEVNVSVRAFFESTSV